MPLVPVPKPTFAQKLKRFFMVDLLQGMAVTLGFNIGALMTKTPWLGRGFTRSNIRRSGRTWRRAFTARRD
jgi:hypothetical protein